MSSDKLIWYSIDELYGKSIEREFIITEELIDHFAHISGDFSSIHISNKAAKAKGFKGRVAHGILLTSFVSAIIGMDLPGEKSILQSIEMKYLYPCYHNDKITIKLEITEIFKSVKTVIAKVNIFNQEGTKVSKAKIQIGLKEDYNG
ncbi:MAG: MaoC/PaaZ C-terminal domain-containing protein [Spirochaetota bacterium]|nr:MaoC/PaaZ C-terminal domain-containing protein [Spirochaetota bacterium]